MQKNLLKKSLAVGIIVLFIGSNFVSGTNIQLKNIINPLTGNCIKTFFVGGYGLDNYTSIQDAINDANDGDTILVYNSIYYKDEIDNYKVNIGKDINIIEIDAYGQVINNNINFIIDAIRFFKIERNKTCVNTFFEIMNNIITIMTYRQKTYHSLHILRNSNPSPTNKAIDLPTNPKLSIKVNDYKGHKMNVTFRSNVSGIWEVIGSNNSIGNGTYSQIPSNMYNYNTKYWWSVNTSCSEGLWCNNTYCFTTSAIKTSVNIITPYNQTISPLEITATGPNDLSNVTLYYRYNETNFTYNYYITSIIESDIFRDGKDSNYMDYPNQMIVRDGIAYIVTYKDDSIVIVNVTNSSNLVEISHRQDRLYLNGAHDIDITNDSKYAYVISYDSPYLCMYNITNKTSIKRVNQKYLTGEKGMYLDLDDNNNFLYVTTMTYIRIYNVTNKNNYQLDLVSSTNVGLHNNSQFWHPLIYKDVLYVAEKNSSATRNGDGIIVYNITDKNNPKYSNRLTSDYLICDQSIYTNKDGYVYLMADGERYINSTYYTGYIIAFNISANNATHPTLMYAKEVIDAGGNFTYGISTFINGYGFICNTNINKSDYRNGFWVYNLTDINNPTYYTRFYGNGSPYYLNFPHEIEFDENGNDDTLYIVCQNDDDLVTFSIDWENIDNLKYNYTIFEIDSESPWSWSYDFPNGTGYYEFYSIGKKIGNIDETSQLYPDTSCHFIST